MFKAIFDFLMTPVNVVRRAFGWTPPEENDFVQDDEPDLQEATAANGGPSVSTFAALRQSVVTEDSGTSLSAGTSMPADAFIDFDRINDSAGLKIWLTKNVRFAENTKRTFLVNKACIRRVSYPPPSAFLGLSTSLFPFSWR